MDGTRNTKKRSGMSRKLLRRFYEALVLLHAIDPIQGSRQRCSSSLSFATEPERLNEALRRSYLDAISYICDFRKGGDTVTAAALQQTPENTILWIASNKNFEKKRKDFLRAILSSLEQNHEHPERVKEKILNKILKNNCLRNKAYVKRLEEFLRKTLRTWMDRASSHVSPEQKASTFASLQKLAVLLGAQDQDENLRNITSFCFTIRKQRTFADLEQLSHSEDTNCPLRRTRHYIGRLGEHHRVTNTLLMAAYRMPQLVSSIEVRWCKPYPEVPMPLSVLDLTGIAGRMTQDQGKAADLVSKLQKYSECIPLLERLEVLRNQKIRVHAELYLVDIFSHNNFEFVDRDRYIGCSKPACFSCNEYVRAHGSGITLPGTHGKVYSRWGLPPLKLPLASTPPTTTTTGTSTLPFSNNNNDLQAQLLNDEVNKQTWILNQMIVPIRRAVFQFVQNNCIPRPLHPDSHTGEFSSVRPEGSVIVEPTIMEQPEPSMDVPPSGGSTGRQEHSFASSSGTSTTTFHEGEKDEEEKEDGADDSDDDEKEDDDDQDRNGDGIKGEEGKQRGKRKQRKHGVKIHTSSSSPGPSRSISPPDSAVSFSSSSEWPGRKKSKSDELYSNDYYSGNESDGGVLLTGSSIM